MNILITAGGTSEKIDDVRKITNTATGKLGALIAEEFSKYENFHVTYIHGSGAVIPPIEELNAIDVSSVSELEKTVVTLMAQKKYDAVIHSMAVSDYSVKSVSTAQETASVIASNLSKKNETDLNSIIKESILQKSSSLEHKKISSDYDNLIVILKKTPKIIGLFKQIQPSILLVGFKLLSGADNDSLLEAGYNLLLKNNCDFVFANDMNNVNPESHSGILIYPDRSYSELSTKREIAETITDKVIKSLKNKERQN